jgi:hypothetical protein
MAINVYIDETFNIRNNYFYLVSILILGSTGEVNRFSNFLSNLERNSRKGKSKWRKCGHERRKKYIDGISQLTTFKEKIYYAFNYRIEQNNVIDFIADTAIRSIEAFIKNYNIKGKIMIYFDSIDKSKKSLLGKRIRSKGIHGIKIKSVRKDENNEFIRLTDAICGLARDFIEDEYTESWATIAMNDLMTKDIVIKI